MEYASTLTDWLGIGISIGWLHRGPGTGPSTTLTNAFDPVSLPPSTGGRATVAVEGEQQSEGTPVDTSKCVTEKERNLSSRNLGTILRTFTRCTLLSRYSTGHMPIAEHT